MKKYFLVWIQLTKNAFSTILSSRIDSFSYLSGKILRFFFFLFLIQGIFQYTNELVGYSKNQVILFFLTYNLIDVTAQAFFRGIYTLKHDIRKGNFDFFLMRPINPLFYVLTKLTDLLDFIFLIPIVYLTVQTVQNLGAVMPVSIGMYIFFLCLGLIIVLAIHVFTAALSIRTVESDHIIWLYRECMTLGRFPPEIFSSKIQFVFTFFIPVIIATGFPVKALFGQIDMQMILLGVVITFLFFGLSLLVWKNNIKYYSSASS